MDTTWLERFCRVTLVPHERNRLVPFLLFQPTQVDVTVQRVVGNTQL